MSTRANIIIKDKYSTLWLYRHSDGYPEGALPTLNIFMDWLKAGKIRNNVSQAAGWLILLGAMEYGAIPVFVKSEPVFKGGHAYGKLDSIAQPDDWKCGAIEPTTEQHGDIEWLYTIDLDAKTLEYHEV